jgi:ethanolamine utilization cobalamin adenosyltransferase
MNAKQQEALDTIINFVLYFTSDENSRERLIEVAYEYVEQDHVLTEENVA